MEEKQGSNKQNTPQPEGNLMDTQRLLLGEPAAEGNFALEDILEDGDEAEVNEDSDGQDMTVEAGMDMDAAAYDDYPEDDDPDGEPEQEGMEE